MKSLESFTRSPARRAYASDLVGDVTRCFGGGADGNDLEVD